MSSIKYKLKLRVANTTTGPRVWSTLAVNELVLALPLRIEGLIVKPMGLGIFTTVSVSMS